jgi:UDP-N-acetylglucosamine 2-epimerase (non-hydrolysing)
MNKKKFCVILGTRPEIIKLSPIIDILNKQGEDYFVIFTKQHFSKTLSINFFKELKIKKIRYSLKIKNQSASTFINHAVKKISEIFITENPTDVIVQGDTNTTLAGCVSVVEHNHLNDKKIKLSHVEAGLRSYDFNMPEECNRIIVDHCSDFLFAPTLLQKKNLILEKISKKKIFVVGNTITDSLKKAKRIKKKDKNYILVTLHRSELLTKKNILKKIIKDLNTVCNILSIKIYFPCHPRTKKIIKSLNIKLNKNFKITKPVGYNKFLKILINSSIVLSDSGGIQEECCILQKKLITLRNNTERPETILIGSNFLIGYNSDKLILLIKKILSENLKWKNPYGSEVSKKIVKIIKTQ